MSASLFDKEFVNDIVSHSLCLFSMIRKVFLPRTATGMFGTTRKTKVRPFKASAVVSDASLTPESIGKLQRQTRSAPKVQRSCHCLINCAFVSNNGLKDHRTRNNIDRHVVVRIEKANGS